MTRKRWFLPETPDVLGMLRRQMRVTIDGVDAFARWAGGDAAAAQPARAERQRRHAKRGLLTRSGRRSSRRMSPRTCSRSRAVDRSSATSPTL